MSPSRSLSTHHPLQCCVTSVFRTASLRYLRIKLLKTQRLSVIDFTYRYKNLNYVSYTKSVYFCFNVTGRTDGRNGEWVSCQQCLEYLTHCCFWTSLVPWCSYTSMVLCLLVMGAQKWDRDCIQKWYRLDSVYNIFIIK